MRTCPVFGAWCVLALAAVCLPTAAQPATDAPDSRPRVGVALGGGGAKGLAHIGVLQVLEELGVPVDLVTGTSMGSVVGGLYATGYSAATLETIAREQDWAALFSNAVPRRVQPVTQRRDEERFLFQFPVRGGRPGLPAGLVAGEQVARTLARLTLPVHDVDDFRDLPIPFACVATDLETGQGVRLDHGYLPRAIRASMAIPTVFTPVRIDGRTYIDGGVSRNLPAEDARALGADVVLCVNVQEPLAPADSLVSLLDILQQAVGYRMSESLAEQARSCDLMIEPDITGLSTLGFDDVAGIVARGDAAARALAPRLHALVDSVGRGTRPPGRAFPVADAVRVRAVRVETPSPALERQVRQALGVEPPARLTADDLEAAMHRVYSRQLFEHVMYRLEPVAADSSVVLVVEAPARNRSRLGIGVRFESHYRASILLDATVQQHRWGDGTAGVHLRLGEVLRLGGTLTRRFPLHPRFGFRLGLEALRAPLDVFEDDVRTSSVRTEVVDLSAGTHLLLSNAAVAGLDLGVEVFNLNRTVGLGDFLDDARALLTAAGRLQLDTFDAAAFPHDGHRLEVRATWATSVYETPFALYSLEWRARWPVRPRLSLTTRLGMGQATGPDAPLHYRFYLGGAFAYDTFADRQMPLLGFDVQQLPGRSAEVVGLGAQYRLSTDVYALAAWNAAYVTLDGARWNLNPGDFRGGVGLTLGARTLVGPVEVTFMSPRLEGPYELQLNVGMVF